MAEETQAQNFGPCPECGLPLSVAVGAEGDPTELLHVLPMCPPFLEKEAEGFLMWVLDIRDAERRERVDS